MKKIILSLFCLLIISFGISCVCASGDITNVTQHQDFLQNDTQNLTVDNTTMVIDQNSTASVTENITADDNGTVQSNETSDNATNNSTNKVNITGPKLNIKGPKLNGTNLNIKGPKIDDNDPNFWKPSYQFFIINFSKVFMNHPGWEVDEIIKAVIKHRPWYEAPKMVSEAYALALQIKGDEMLYKDGLTAKYISSYITNHPDRIFPGYEDYPWA